MYGTLIRAGLEALFIALLGAVFVAVMSPLLSAMYPAANEDDLLINALTAAQENFILIGIIAILVTVIATAILEGSIGGGR